MVSRSFFELAGVGSVKVEQVKRTVFAIARNPAGDEVLRVKLTRDQAATIDGELAAVREATRQAFGRNLHPHRYGQGDVIRSATGRTWRVLCPAGYRAVPMYDCVELVDGEDCCNPTRLVALEGCRCEPVSLTDETVARLAAEERNLAVMVGGGEERVAEVERAIAGETVELRAEDGETIARLEVAGRVAVMSGFGGNWHRDLRGIVDLAHCWNGYTLTARDRFEAIRAIAPAPATPVETAVAAAAEEEEAATPAPPAAPIAASRRAVLMACGATKSHTPGRIAAYERYDGPAWRTLRAWFLASPVEERVDVLVLSARFGFIHGSDRIPDYEEEMSERRAVELLEKPEVIASLRELVAGVDEVFLGGGSLYRWTMRQALERARFAGRIVEPRQARGIGDLLAALREYVAPRGTLQAAA